MRQGSAKNMEKKTEDRANREKKTKVSKKGRRKRDKKKV